jgi:hypothetical protein
MSASDINIDASYRIASGGLPPSIEQANKLADFTVTLNSLGVSQADWLLPVENLKTSPRLQAFDGATPARELVKAIEAENIDNPQAPSFGVWTGNDDSFNAALSACYNDYGLSTVSFQSNRFRALMSYHALTIVLESGLSIWPAAVATVAPFRYWGLKVFPDRPGVGWMLYLPRRIEQEQVPEAPMIRHVKDLNGTEGTIIISVIDGPFDAENAAHVRVANAIEIRLADQDLLPRYVDI